MVPTRKTNQENSRIHGDDLPLFGPGGLPLTGSQTTIVLTPEELAQIVSNAVEKVMAKKASSHHSTQPEHGEHEQGRENREEDGKEDKRESSAGSKSPTVEEELEELRRNVKVLEGLVGSRGSARTMAKGSPFSDVIVREPGQFKSAKIKDYDWSSDREEHLARFENMAMLHCYGDRIKCKVLLTILVDSAQRWFEGLSPQSIQSFEDFQKLFLHKFSGSKKYKKTPFSLF